MQLKPPSNFDCFTKSIGFDNVAMREKVHNYFTCKEEEMKYLIIGAGGTGGSIAAFMSEAGKDVTVIARGEHLAEMQKNGLKMQTTTRGDYTVFPIKVCSMEHYHETPDIIFVCVKGYSLESIIPFIERVSHKETIVIPILNIYGTGGMLQKHLPHLLVTDGCIYIAAEIKEAGKILQTGDIFRVVFGVREPKEYRSLLKVVETDLNECGIRAILSDNIQRDALQKFSFVSPMAGCGAYYDVNAEKIQEEGEAREMFIALVKEIMFLAQAMGITLPSNSVEKNLAILDALAPQASTSMQRDLRQAKSSEIEGLIFEVVRLANQHHVSVPVYRRVAQKFGFKA